VWTTVSELDPSMQNGLPTCSRRAVPTRTRGRGSARSAAHSEARPDARLGRREPVLHRAQATREAPLPLRLLICDLVGEDVTRRSMATLRDDLADVHARLDDAEQSAAGSPPREAPADRRSLPAAPARPPRGTRRRGRTGARHDTTGAVSRPRPVAATGICCAEPTSLAMRPARARGSHRRSTRGESNGRSGITRLRFA
jgi:hypothetical protein